MPTPDFIISLREKVGHAPLWLPGVTAVVMAEVPPEAPIFEVPKVLLVRRTDNGEWTPVGGIPEPGESPHEAAVREVYEETRIHSRAEAILGAGAVGPITYPNGDVAQYYTTTLRLRALDADGRLADPRHLPEPVVGDDESTDVGWFEISKMPVKNPRFRMVIADAAAQMKHPAGFRPRMGYEKRG